MSESSLANALYGIIAWYCKPSDCGIKYRRALRLGFLDPYFIVASSYPFMIAWLVIQMNLFRVKEGWILHDPTIESWDWKNSKEVEIKGTLKEAENLKKSTERFSWPSKVRFKQW